MVTHNMQQAARISDNTAFFLLGELVEFGNTEQIFSMPKDKRTEDYITGRFGCCLLYTSLPVRRTVAGGGAGGNGSVRLRAVPGRAGRAGPVPVQH